MMKDIECKPWFCIVDINDVFSFISSGFLWNRS